MSIATIELSDVLNDDYGITTGTAAAVALNTAKVTYPSAASTKVNLISVAQAVNLDTMESDIEANKTPAVVIQPATDTLSATECSNTLISNYGQSAENTQTLCAAADKLSGIVTIATAGAGNFNLKAGASDKIYLDGVALDDGDKVTLDTPLLGDFFSFVSFKSGASSYDWIVRTGQGTLIDGGA